MLGPMWHVRRAVPLLLVVVLAATLGPDLAANATSHDAAIKEARKALIVLSDFPKGWTTSPSGNGSGSGGNNNLGVAQVAACLGVSQKVVNYNPPSAYSPDFNQNASGLSAADNVEIFPNAEITTQQFELYSAVRTPACFAQTFNTPSVKVEFARQFGAGATVGEVTSAALPRPRVKERATAISLTFPISQGGAKFMLSLVIVIIVSRLEGAELDFSSILGQSFPSSLEAHLETVTANRLG